MARRSPATQDTAGVRAVPPADCSCAPRLSNDMTSRPSWLKPQNVSPLSSLPPAMAPPVVFGPAEERAKSTLPLAPL